jgi:hypothetical protein
VRRLARLYLAAGLDRLADGITAWRLARGLLTPHEEEWLRRVADRADHRDAIRPPAWPSPGGDA